MHDRLSQERWQAACRIFQQCLAVREFERSALLDRLCGHDPEMLRTVVELLADDARAESACFLEEAPDIVAPARDWLIGKRLGRYQVLSKIGEGGMSAVYRAQRIDSEYQSTVAIKLLRAPLSGSEMQRRLRRERQVLAALNHPNIARLLDGGTTEFGAPYIVMEYVRGPPITDYCRAHELTERERIELFLKVCAAVRHAHANLVIHRDIKPGNILIADEEVPKLLDFGIAKLLDAARFHEPPEQTAPERRLLTPDYASPEQASGGPITTASDVYSLGILLHCLLTGEIPRRDPETSPGAEASLSRAASVDRIALGGDLGVIVAYALRPEPERRYQTVSELAADLARYLAGEPVSARPNALGYRTARFVRRHPAGVAMAAAGLLAVTAFSVFTQFQAAEIARQRDRAEGQRELAFTEQQRAETVSRFLIDIFRSADPTRSRGREVTALELLAAGSQRVEGQLASQPMVQASVWETMGEAYLSLGAYREAGEAHRKALELRQRDSGPRQPPVAASRTALAEVALLTADYAAALDQAGRAIAILESVDGADPVALAATLFLRGRINTAIGNGNEGQADYQRALALQEAHLPASHPELLATRLAMAASLAASGDYAAAEPLVRQVLTLQRGLPDAEPHALAATISQLAELLRKQGQFEPAEPLAREALALTRTIYGPRHAKVAAGLNGLSNIYQKLGDHEKARLTLNEGIEIIAETLGEDHPKYALMQYNMGVLLHQRLRRLAEAEPYYRRAYDVARSALGEDHSNTGVLGMGYGLLMIDQGRPAEAEIWLSASLDVFERRNAPRGRNIASARTRLGQALVMMNRHQEAAELLRLALPIHTRERGPDHELTVTTRELLALTSGSSAAPGAEQEPTFEGR